MDTTHGRSGSVDTRQWKALGIAAALHAAVVLEPRRPCGLATLALFEGRSDVLAPTRGRLAVPLGAGLGDGLRSWYEWAG